MSFMKRLQRGRRRFLWGAEGSSAVEMALAVPALLLMFCGLLDFGNLYLQRNLVAEAAREGARMAATQKTGTPPAYLSQTAVQTNIRTEYSNSNLTLTMTPSTPATGSPVAVTVTLSVPILTPGISTIFTSLSIPVPVTVTGRCVMQAE